MTTNPSETPENAIDIRGLSKSFLSQSVFRDLSLAVKQGEFLTFVGPSGCGKSTLLRLIAGLEQPDSGRVAIGRTEEQDASHRQELAFVFQDSNLLPWLSTFDNVALPYRITNRPVDEARINETLKMVGIESADFRKLPKQLSGGMKMRVSIARALVLKPRILLMDEPFAALDEMLRNQLNLDLMRIWHESKVSIVFVTHNLTEAIFVSQRIAILQPNQQPELMDVPFDYPRTIKDRSSSEFVNLYEKLSRRLEGSIDHA